MLLRAHGERLSTACGEGHLLFPQQSRDKMLLTACQDDRDREALPQLVGSFSCEGPHSRGSSETSPSSGRGIHERREEPGD